MIVLGVLAGIILGYAIVGFICVTLLCRFYNDIGSNETGLFWLSLWTWPAIALYHVILKWPGLLVGTILHKVEKIIGVANINDLTERYIVYIKRKKHKSTKKDIIA